MDNQISMFEDFIESNASLPEVSSLPAYGITKLPEYSLVTAADGEYDVYKNGELVGVIVLEEKRDSSYRRYLSYVCDPDAPEKYMLRSRRNIKAEYVYTWDNCLTMMQAKKLIMDNVQQASGDKSRKKSVPVYSLPVNDMEFYPTPSDIAGKLFAMIDWKAFRNSHCAVLEPSAGRGDLIEFLRSTMGYEANNRASIDVIEIDTNLQAMLKGKGYRLVGDDFLEYKTSKAYDLIAMNPPFFQGDLHLLHAIDLMRNGQIVCILNAETIRNPYTNTRKQLAKELKRLNANIRYVNDGMRKGVRRASVDLALVHIKVDAVEKNDWIWENLKKAGETVFDDQSEESKAMTFSNPVDRLIREYNLTISAGIEFFKTYNGLREHLSNVGVGVCIGKNTCWTSISNDFVNEFIVNTRGEFWKRLFDLPELQSQMTTDMKNEYDSKIRNMKEYEFTEFNIRQVIDELKVQLNDGVVDAIYKCFDKLSNIHTYHEDLDNENIHYFNGWKTNKAHYVNMRCIIPTYGAFAHEFRPDKTGRYKEVYTDIDPRSCFAVLDDLEKALDYLDCGETFPSDLLSQLQRAAHCGKTTVECKYFTVTFYKKGTCHIKFRDQKIVDRLNIFVGLHRMWLPPTYGKVKYEEMDTESRRVVDEFLGKDHYDKVMVNPGNYIIDASKSGNFLMATTKPA